MAKTDFIPTHYRGKENAGEVLTFIQASELDLDDRKSAWEKWCDRVGYIPQTDEDAALAIGL